MKTEISSHEAKIRLPELLRAVQEGKSFTITNRGKVVANLVPAETSKLQDAAEAAADMKAFMLSDPVCGIDIKTLCEGLPLATVDEDLQRAAKHVGVKRFRTS